MVAKGISVGAVGYKERSLLIQLTSGCFQDVEMDDLTRIQSTSPQRKHTKTKLTFYSNAGLDRVFPHQMYKNFSQVPQITANVEPNFRLIYPFHIPDRYTVVASQELTNTFLTRSFRGVGLTDDRNKRSEL